MSNVILKKEWIKWYPKKIYLKNITNNTTILTDLDVLKEENFYEILDCKKINKNKKDNIKLEQMNAITTKSYNDGFKEGVLKAQKENILLKNKLNAFFLEFEQAFSVIENKLYIHLVKIILTISSYITGKKVNINQSILTNYIKKIINNEGVFLKNPQLFIHSENKIFIEKIFKDFLSTNQWKLIYDDNLDINGFKIKSENFNIDATSDARWQELYRFIDSEEY